MCLLTKHCMSVDSTESTLRINKKTIMRIYGQTIQPIMMQCQNYIKN